MRSYTKRAVGHAVVLAMLSACHGLEPRQGGAGSTVWHVAGAGYGTPVFDDSLVYFLGASHDVVSVAKVSGVSRWRQTVESSGGTGGHSLALVNDLVIVGDHDVHALNRYTGSIAWNFHPLDGYSPGLFKIVTDGQRVYTGSPAGRAYAIDASTGGQAWMTVIADDGNTSVFDPVISGGSVYVCVVHFTQPTTGGIVALDAATGAVQWTFDFPPTAPNNEAGCARRAAVAGNLVFGASFNGHIFAVNRATGLLQYTIPQITGLPSGTGGSPLLDQRPLVVSGTTLFAGSTTGYVTAFDVSNGTEIWRGTANRGSVVYPLAADGASVYAVHDGFQLAAFDAASGRLQWLRDDMSNGGGGEFVYSPAIDADLLFVPGVHGFYALRR